MGVDEKMVRLKITCSYPSVLGNAVSKFMAFDVKDDESLQLILEMASSNTAINSVDLYIEIANIPMAPQTIDDWIGPYTSLLTEEGERSNPVVQGSLPSTSTQAYEYCEHVVRPNPLQNSQTQYRSPMQDTVSEHPDRKSTRLNSSHRL